MPASAKKSVALKRKLAAIYDRLLAVYGPQKCFLNHETPFQLLVATILSAQCTDKMVNRVTESLFRDYPEPADFAKMDPEQLEKLIHSCGYYRAKAKNIIAASRAIVERFHSKIPNTMEELTSLPGVGRKTANVVLADAFRNLSFCSSVKRRGGITFTHDLGMVKSTAFPSWLVFCR